MKIAFIHTSATLVPIFADLAQSRLSGHKIFNLVDDSLIKDVIEAGTLTPKVARRVVQMIGLASDAGAGFILVTCSSIGKAVETAAGLTTVPVLRVDQPMADQAVRTGHRIGVVATLETTLQPTVDLVHRRARKANVEVQITSEVCSGAFAALMSGDPELHDARVLSALRRISGEVDVILLAQASMARVADQLDEKEKGVPILASPPTAMEYLATVLPSSGK